MKKRLCIPVGLLVLAGFVLGADSSILVHFYPRTLTSGDRLTDGRTGDRLEIEDGTFLIWVDLHPKARFTHRTLYILVSPAQIRVEQGGWRPFLNGKRLFSPRNPDFAMISPFEIKSPLLNGTAEAALRIHVWPEALRSSDVLTDGPQESAFSLEDDTLLVWVDLLPGAYFAHPTAFILISGSRTRAEHGMWWPELNGKPILYGESNPVGVISPFRLSVSSRH